MANVERAAMDHLFAERSALMSGNFSELAVLESQRDRVLEALQFGHPDADALARLRSVASRNAQLIEAALGGLRSAKARMNEISEVARELGAYGANGKRLDFATGRRFEKRS